MKIIADAKSEGPGQITRALVSGRNGSSSGKVNDRPVGKT
jgi:hypothetical protein